MPRKGPVTQSGYLRPDVVYGSRLVSRLINQIMRRGKKSMAEADRLRRAGADGRTAASKDPLERVRAGPAGDRCPQVEVKPRRVGGATYQVPVEVRPTRKLALALRWLVTSARSRGGRTMMEKLAGELLDAADRPGQLR